MNKITEIVKGKFGLIGLMIILFSSNIFSQIEYSNTNFKINSNYYPFKSDSLFGYSNKNGEVYIKPVYEKVSPFYSNNSAKVKLNNKFYIITSKGELINNVDGLDFENGLDELSYNMEHNCWHFKKDSLAGIIDSLLTLEIIGKHRRYTNTIIDSIYRVGSVNSHKFLNNKNEATFSNANGRLDTLLGNEYILTSRHAPGWKKGSVFEIYNLKTNKNISKRYNKVIFDFWDSHNLLICRSEVGYELLNREFQIMYEILASEDLYQNLKRIPKEIFSYLYELEFDLNCQYSNDLNYFVCSNGDSIISINFDFHKFEKEKVLLIDLARNIYVTKNKKGKTFKNFDRENIRKDYFSSIRKNEDGKLIISKHEGRWKNYLLDNNLEPVQDFYFLDKFLVGRIGDSKKAIRKQGMNSDFIYDEIIDINRDCILAKRNSHFDLVEKGEIIKSDLAFYNPDLIRIHRCFSRFYGKRILIEKNERFGLLDFNGNEIINLKYYNIVNPTVRKYKGIKGPKTMIDYYACTNEKGNIDLFDHNGNLLLTNYENFDYKNCRLIVINDSTIIMYNGITRHSAVIYKNQCVIENARISLRDYYIESDVIEIEDYLFNVKNGKIYKS